MTCWASLTRATLPDDRSRCAAAAVDRAGERCLTGPQNPAVYVVEDAHWIDDVSESMLADFLTMIPQTPSLVLITYRPEYHGALTRVADIHTISLVPLSDSDTATLVADLFGADPTIEALGRRVAETGRR